MRRVIAPLMIAASVGMAFPAAAATVVSWSTTNTNTSWVNSLGYTSSGQALTVTAYSTSGTPAAVGQPGQLDGSNWLQAQLWGYGGGASGGFGVRNAKACTSSSQSTCNTRGHDYNEGTAPEHAIDNEQFVDIVVFELPQIAGYTWSFQSLSIGYVSNDATPEVNIWIGGNPGIDFTSTCFTGCGNSLDAQGFVYAGRVDFSTGGNGKTNAVINAADTGGDLFADRNANATGQYIVIASSYAATDVVGSGKKATNEKKWDAFKITGLQANKIDLPPPSTNVPEPGTIALLAGGLLGFGLMRRRSSV